MRNFVKPECPICESNQHMVIYRTNKEGIPNGFICWRDGTKVERKAADYKITWMRWWYRQYA